VGGTVVVIIIAAVIATQILKSLERKVNLMEDQVRQILKTDLSPGTAKIGGEAFSGRKGLGLFRRWINDPSDSSRCQSCGLVRTDIQMRFHFDAEDKLISYELKDTFTGS
jgi:hypothetical protein